MRAKLRATRPRRATVAESSGSFRAPHAHRTKLCTTDPLRATPWFTEPSPPAPVQVTLPALQRHPGSNDVTLPAMWPRPHTPAAPVASRHPRSSSRRNRAETHPAGAKRLGGSPKRIPRYDRKRPQPLARQGTPASAGGGFGGEATQVKQSQTPQPAAPGAPPPCAARTKSEVVRNPAPTTGSTRCSTAVRSSGSRNLQHPVPRRPAQLTPARNPLPSRQQETAHPRHQG